MIDTGASYTGRLTLMNVDTDEYWQSEPVCDYYPGVKSRGHRK
jgi:serine/threonine protein phosphatase 1